jgi:GntR family transcriptional regulator
MHLMVVRYQQIAADLRTRVASGQYEEGKQLPSEAALAAGYQCGVPTLRNALELLQAEGLLEKLHGRGNYVRRASAQRLTYTHDRRAASNTAPRVDVTDHQHRAERELPALLDVAPGSSVTEYRFISHDQGTPQALARVYVPAAVGPVHPPQDGASPWGDDVRRQLVSDGVRLARTTERVTARFPAADEAEWLRISARAPVLVIERITHDSTGRVVEAAVVVLRSDRTEAVFTTYQPTSELDQAL